MNTQQISESNETLFSLGAHEEYSDILDWATVWLSFCVWTIFKNIKKELVPYLCYQFKPLGTILHRLYGWREGTLSDLSHKITCLCSCLLLTGESQKIMSPPPPQLSRNPPTFRFYCVMEMEHRELSEFPVGLQYFKLLTVS